MALNKNSLKAAVKKFQPMLADGKPEAEIKKAIEEDEKQFDEDAVNEIYAALSDPQFQQGQAGAYTVIKEFRDINDYSKVYEVGSDASHFGSKRLQHLVKHELVEKSD